MLSSQTRDEITHAAVVRLHTGGLTVEGLAAMDPQHLGALIYPVGFWKKKVGRFRVHYEFFMKYLLLNLSYIVHEYFQHKVRKMVNFHFISNIK